MGLTLQQALSQGATFVNPAQSAATAAYQSFGKPAQTTPAAPAQPNLLQKATGGVVNYVRSVAGDVKSGVQSAVSDIKNTAITPGSLKSDTTASKQFQGGFQAGGDIAGAIMSPLTEGIKGIANALAGNKAVQAVADSPAGTAITNAGNAVTNNPVTQKLTEWAQAHPEAAKDLSALGNIAALGTTIPAGGAAADVVPEAASKVADVASAAADKVSSALPDIAPKAAEPTADSILASRTADATPSYSPKIAGDYITNPQGEVVPRVNEGEGLTGNRTVNTSKSEAANAAELAKIKNYPDNGTALQKSQAVHAEISTEAKGLKTALAAEDKAAPLVSSAKDQIYKGVFDNMNGDARDAFITRGRGLEEKAGIPVEPGRTIVARYGQDVADELGKYDGTRQGILNLRQNLDSVYEDARGKSAFGSDHRNALDEMHTSIRDYLNKELHDSTKSTDVQASLDKQSKLYRAKDVLDNKAEKEAPSAFKRFMAAHPTTRFAGRILERQAIRIPLEVAGVTALGAWLRKQLTK